MDIVCRGRGISVDDESGTNEEFGERASDDNDQVQGTGDSGVELRPGWCEPICHRTFATPESPLSFANRTDGDRSIDCLRSWLRAVAYEAGDSLAALRR